METKEPFRDCKGGFKLISMNRLSLLGGEKTKGRGGEEKGVGKWFQLRGFLGHGKLERSEKRIITREKKKRGGGRSEGRTWEGKQKKTRKR